VRFPQTVGVDAIGSFSEVIDVRSPGEFAEDHVPGAINCPVLDDAERAEVGTINAQVSPFAAKRRGAALVSANIARHLEERFADRSPEWKPLIYCWRGGKRSRSLALVLHEIGWHPALLEGGYKAYRRAVRADLDTLPSTLRFRVICGETGSAKSRLLEALAEQGAQVLDLEALANHRGSVLGDLTHAPQPGQRRFETCLHEALRRFSSARVVFVEAESRKIGNLQVPDALITAMRASPCLRIEADRAARVDFLLAEYAHFVTDPSALGQRLDYLVAMHSRERIEQWKAQAASGDSAGFVADILESHYDPAYRRSTDRNFPHLAEAPRVQLAELSAGAVRGAANSILETLGEAPTVPGAHEAVTHNTAPPGTA
jgi:tRNA 2-selenouridine synthase